jgi:UDP-N-acetylmuramoyl-L-alanyl-D-glutamate--2,6-diaminopimelate ligase
MFAPSGDRLGLRLGRQRVGAGGSFVPTLDHLAALVPGARPTGDASIRIEDIAHDSRAVRPGALFFCVRGSTRDGHAFAAEAVGAGAVALVVDRSLDLDVTQLVVDDVRAAMGAIAAPFFGEPSRAMEIVGVTGTNGKTTSTFMLDGIARARRRVPGLLGTVEQHIGDDVEPVAFTTPEAIDLQRVLARMRDAGVEQVAMEVSSHGLAYGRVTGTRFACALFTNLSRDHLDLHGSMQEYFDAKASLFDERYTSRGVVNLDDEAGAAIRERSRIEIVTYAVGADADVRARRVEHDRRGSGVEVEAGGAVYPLRVPLPGPYNVANALGVFAVGVALGWDPDEVATGIASVTTVPGRLESVDAGQPFSVLVDYAHTPDALANVLRAARALTDGRLIVVFGCGGDRDVGKRPEMGRVATELADLTFITSDNPRSEHPASIVAAIEGGARPGSFTSIVDRAEAIAAAISQARDGDVVVIAGKGHETGQRFADRVIPFDDRIVARQVLEGRA